MRKRVLSAIVLCMATTVAHADDFADASLALCEKVKSCALAQMAEADLTPEAREMMQPVLDSMCAQMKGAVSQVTVGHPLYKPGLACMQSMQSLSCEMMQESAQQPTPACETLEKLAREVGDADEGYSPN